MRVSRSCLKWLGSVPGMIVFPKIFQNCCWIMLCISHSSSSGYEFLTLVFQNLICILFSYSSGYEFLILVFQNLHCVENFHPELEISDLNALLVVLRRCLVVDVRRPLNSGFRFLYECWLLYFLFIVKLHSEYDNLSFGFIKV